MRSVLDLAAGALGVTLALAVMTVTTVQAQAPAEVIRHGYADMIVVNGKIVSMDDQSYNTNPGRVYEAMAVKGNLIMALGTSQQIRAMAGNDTRVIDVGGRTVLPGLIMTHAHLFGDSQTALAMGIRSPHRGVSITLQADRNLESTRLKIENALRDQAEKLESGDWIVMGLTGNPELGVTSPQVMSWHSHGALTSRTRMDNVAPENPVLLQAGSRGIMNSAAFEAVAERMPYFSDYEEFEVSDLDGSSEVGVVAVGGMTAIEWEVFYGNQPNATLAEMIRQDWAMGASHGMTAFGSRVHHPRIMEAVSYLNREKASPVRFMALLEMHRRPNDPESTPDFYTRIGNMTGVGDDMLWVGGIASELWDSSFPANCTGPDLPATAERKKLERCLEPNDMYWKVLQNALERGWRLAGIHGVASDGIRRYIQMIEMAMKNSGMTVEDIRRLRLTTEHQEALGMPRDVLAKLKEYGILVNPQPSRMGKWKDYVRDYGPEAEAFMQPIKSWMEEGLMVTAEIGYQGIGSGLNLVITRDIDGKMLLPDQAIDRVPALKMLTTWASRYLLREDKIGTLETGKLADFVVLDKDYFTIPVEQIPTIKPQMTVMGGKPRYIGQEFGQQIGMEPVGWQYPANYMPWQ